jgi:interferon-induced GTP-binding protein Mx1
MQSMQQQPGVAAAASEPGVASEFQQNARPLIDFIDTLRCLGIEKDLPIPQIAVMGDQSSGKSSVLEALSGIPFPRGAGLVTRCATQIRMGKGNCWCAEASVRSAVGNPKDAERVRTADTPEALGGIIEALTKEMCGDSAFSKDVIEISLRSPDAPDLTVIDLPGIVRTTTAGQDKGVVDDVNALLESYLQPARTIILAVIPCNVDVATVDILERAAKVDPEGIRTVGVLTKPDLIDKGGELEVLEVLLNNRKPLKLGFCMVKNRSQNKLDKNQKLEVARAAEAKYFETHEVFKQAPAALLGVSSLTSKLTDLLVGHIKHVLPDLMADMSSALVDTHKKLLQCGDSPPANAGEQRLEAARAMQAIAGLLSKSVSSGTLAVGMMAQAGRFAQRIQETKPDFYGSKDRYHCQISFILDEQSHKCEFLVDAKHLALKEPAKGIGKRLSIGTEVVSTCLLSQSCTVICPDGSEQKGKLNEEKGTGVTTGYRFALSWGDGCTHQGAWTPDPSFTISGTSETYHTKLAQQLESCRARPLPGFLNFEVFTAQVITFVNDWRQATTDMIKSIKDLVQSELDHITAAVIPCKYPALRMSVQSAFDRSICLAFHGSTSSGIAGVVSSVRQAFDREREPSTQNHYLMGTVSKLRGDRFLKCMDQALQNENKYTGAQAKDIFKMWFQNSMGNASNAEQEANDMTDFLAAYWKVAAKRLIDNVQQICDQELVRGLPALCNEELQQAVTAASDTCLTQLFAVPSSDRNRRQRLQAKLDRLVSAKQKYAELILAVDTPRNHAQEGASSAAVQPAQDDNLEGFEIDADSL